MTDKQMIINGVDVSKCIFFSKGITHNLCKEPQEIDEECKYNPNCYYKLLSRKEQEYQHLINKNNRLEEELNATKLLLEGKNNQYAAKEQECENWKNRSDEWMSRCEQETKLREFINEQLEQEQTLKEIYFTYYKAKHSDIKGKFFQYKQTLTKIKEIAEKQCICGVDCIDMKLILELIREVEND